ncbi:hypothetical protein F5887DRAFT_968837, partial [Amanita rubescens]
QPKPCLSDLPVELQRQIIMETYDLVCRTFNAIVAPYALSCICLFRDEKDLLGNLRQLRTLLSSKPTQHLCMADTLVLKEWIWIYGVNPYFYHDLPTIGSFVLLNSLVALLFLVSLPYTLPVAVFKTSVRLHARFRLSGKFKINLPNIRRVVWTVFKQDPKWLLSRSVKLLLRIPQLEELALVIDERSNNLDCLAQSLSQLHTLRKLELDFRFRKDKLGSPRNYEIHKFGKVIAANSNLTHLKLKNSGTGDNADLSHMFSYVSADRPLKLEHLTLSGLFFGEEAITPHIRSLTSFHLSNGVYLRLLLAEGIFPPHPRITSLSFVGGCQGEPIFETIARHSASLTHLSIYAWKFYDLLERIANETILLRCTDLQELVFYYHRNVSGPYPQVTPEMEKALTIVARLQTSLILVITAYDVFKCCVQHCRLSRNPLLRDLSKRIVFQKS